jgi:hypothetical protein
MRGRMREELPRRAIHDPARIHVEETALNGLVRALRPRCGCGRAGGYAERSSRMNETRYGAPENVLPQGPERMDPCDGRFGQALAVATFWA